MTPPPNRPPEAARWDEMWDGVLYVPPYMTRTQSDLRGELQVFLYLNWAPATHCRIHHDVNLVMPADVPNWLNNYRIPDLVLLTPPRFGIDFNEYMAGAPDAVVEVHAPGDWAYEKLPFYAALGVPEVWIINRDTKVPELFALTGTVYVIQPPAADGWVVSRLGIELRAAPGNKLGVRLTGGATAELPFTPPG